MPTKQLKTWAEKAGVSVEEAEEKWNECKEQAKKKTKEDSTEYWKYVNVCTRKKLGIDNKAMEELCLFAETKSKLKNW